MRRLWLALQRLSNQECAWLRYLGRVNGLGRGPFAVEPHDLANNVMPKRFQLGPTTGPSTSRWEVRPTRIGPEPLTVSTVYLRILFTGQTTQGRPK